MNEIHKTMELVLTPAPYIEKFCEIAGYTSLVKEYAKTIPMRISLQFLSP
jgi:hypothetical protein